MAQVLIAGLGDLGTSLAQQWLAMGHGVSGIRRGIEAPDGVALISQDLLSARRIRLPKGQVDLLYIILTPAERTEAGYVDAYLKAPERLLDALVQVQPLPPTIFVSSTAVYGDDGGDVDEETIARPAAFNGRVLVAAEEAIAARALATTVRFSGIYGPGRLRLIDQAKKIAAGEVAAPPPRFTNRIHSADCVALLKHLGESWLGGGMPPGMVIGTDTTPAINTAVLNFIGEQLGFSLDLPEPDIAPGKRLYSRYLSSPEGVALQFPDFRAGYSDVLALSQ